MKRFLLQLLFVVFVSLPLCSVAQTSAEVETAQTATVEQTININSADAATLQQALNGVGAVKAKAIVDYRQEHGAFATVDELLEVKGIGASILQKNRAKLRVN